MKKTCITLVLMLSAYWLQAQQTGIVQYERTTKIQMNTNNLPEGAPNIPNERKAKQELLFNDSTSLYRDVIEDEPEAFEGGGNVRMFRFGGGNTQFYKNFNSLLLVEAREMFDRKYLINDTIKPQKWKPQPGETRIIAGHTCYKATLTITATEMFGNTRRITLNNGSQQPASDTTVAKTPAPPRTVEIEAWYAVDIPVPTGPDTYGGLPGLILGLYTNDGRLSIVATNVSLTANVHKDLKQPSKGKAMSRAAFVEELRKIMEEQRANMGGRGRVIMQ
ncbi:MAG: GLPGLI family protein [Chitinophagaceae bacterium]